LKRAWCCGAIPTPGVKIVCDFTERKKKSVITKKHRRITIILAIKVTNIFQR
jgi:hypothetical protein